MTEAGRFDVADEVGALGARDDVQVERDADAVLVVRGVELVGAPRLDAEIVALFGVVDVAPTAGERRIGDADVVEEHGFIDDDVVRARGEGQHRGEHRRREQYG